MAVLDLESQSEETVDAGVSGVETRDHVAQQGGSPDPAFQPSPAMQTPLAQRAMEFLQIAARTERDESEGAGDGRSIWEPDSWLMQRTWQELAEQGAVNEALTVASLQEMRNPLAPIQAIYRLAKRAADEPRLRSTVADELMALHVKLFGSWVVSDDTRQTERLLLAAASAVQIGDESLAFACLERLDQLPRGWDLVILRAELRAMLAETISALGLHPLTNYLITTAIRRHEEAGAEFLHQIVSRLQTTPSDFETSHREARLLRKCVETFQYATLSSLNSRRLAAIVFGRAGMIDDVLAQVTTMANVQEARRETGLTSSSGDPHFLRQVTRPNANPDVDFQVYTLQQSIALMPVRQITREHRVLLAGRVAELAVQSDGWTAAGATSTLVGLGALKFAVDVVDYIAPGDPTRSEGVISLIRALLDVGNADQAREQVDKALVWLKDYAGRNPERATIWGVADVYLDYGHPDMALYLLEQRHEESPSFAERLRRMVRSGWTDDILRDNRVRFRALLQREADWTSELNELYAQLRRWAPVLLDGEALITFYLDALLAPLLEDGQTTEAIKLLPDLATALGNSTGDKHSVHVRKACNKLSTILDQTPDGIPPEVPGATSDALERFLEELWANDAHRSVWQIVHGVEGSLPLVYGLEGSRALVAIAESTANDGGLWLQ